MVKRLACTVCAVLVVAAAAVPAHSADKTKPPKPDLAVIKIKIEPQIAKKDDWVTFSGKVVNVGQAPSAACQFAIRVGDDAELKLLPLPVLAPNESYPISYEQVMPEPGLYRVLLIADYYKTVDESDEFNNAKYIGLRVNDIP